LILPIVDIPVLVSMVAIKVPFPDSLSSLAKQICDRNNKIAIFYKLTTSDCEFTSKGLVSFGPNTNQ
jgi:hypothetical protein